MPIVTDAIDQPRGGSHPGNLQYYCQLSVYEYTRQRAGSKNTPGKMLGSIKLPLPSDLRDETAVGYTNVNLQTVGDLFSDQGFNTAAFGMRAAAGIYDEAAAFALDVVGSAGLLGSVAKKVGSTVKSQIPGELVTSATEQAAGLAPNPNPSVAFEGPLLRDFSLSWNFLPRGPNESANIKNIVKFLKAKALPSSAVNGAAAILNYPAIVQLNFYPWDNGAGANEWGWSDNSIIKIKKCFMSSVNVNYTNGNSPAFFGDNRPVAMSLSIGFKEIEYLTSYDYGDAIPSVPADDAFNRYWTASAPANILVGEQATSTTKTLVEQTGAAPGELEAAHAAAAKGKAAPPTIGPKY